MNLLEFFIFEDIIVLSFILHWFCHFLFESGVKYLQSCLQIYACMYHIHTYTSMGWPFCLVCGPFVLPVTIEKWTVW